MHTAGRAFLFLRAGRRVYRCQFTKDLTFIGSGPDNDIVVRDSLVEVNHAQISRAGTAYTLRPIDGAEVRIDGEPLDSALELYNGNMIGIGDVEILFAREQSESQSPIHLIIRKPGEPLMGFWTAKSTVVIGRDKGDIILDDPLVSKVHAVIENFCTGGHFVVDARSERGTALNGESIDARHGLEDGDTLTLGGVEVEFRTTPFGSPASRDAVQLAAEQLEAVRKLEREKRDSTGRAPGLKNPYQRYQTGARIGSGRIRGASRDDSPRGYRSGSTTNGAMDLTTGVQTGIVASATESRYLADLQRASSNQSRHRSEQYKLPSEAAPEPLEPTYKPVVQETLKPRKDWGNRSNQRDGIGEREGESDTRLHLGGQDGSALWYLPEESGGKPSPHQVPKPVIRARGDALPVSEQRSMSDSKDQDRARIRRPSSVTGEIAPMQAKAVLQSASEEPNRFTPAPVVLPGRPGAGKPVNVSSQEPRETERWYAASEREPGARQDGHDDNQPWYVPKNSDRGKAGSARRAKASKTDHSKGQTGGKTQMIDE